MSDRLNHQAPRALSLDPGEGAGPKNPGDEVAPGTPQTGEDVCPRCEGSGKLEGQACPDCGGSGTVIV